MTSAISVRGVSKRFRLYHERYQSLKERVVRFGRKNPYDEFWALDGINLEIEQGTTVGLLGHNGSGKSTLLKCVAGILQPTEGEIVTSGRMAALLELGAGFQPELTGRENVYLNGAILGMGKRELERRFDAIVEFAELQQFIDTQVRFYSSGMYVRLGFAVAVNVDPDILLVDEVLAVGDEAFQRKCLDRVRQFQREGRTIVVVTHAADMVRQVCDVAAVLDHGSLVFDGAPGDAVRTFREHLLQHEPFAEGDVDADAGAVSISSQEQKRDFRIRITSVDIEHPWAADDRPLLPNEPLTLRVHFEAAERMEDVSFGVAIHDVEGNLVFGSNTRLMEQRLPPIQGKGEVAFEFTSVPLLDGTYFVTIGITSLDEGAVYDWHEQRYRFEVVNPGQVVGNVALPLRIHVRTAAGPEQVAS